MKFGTTNKGMTMKKKFTKEIEGYVFGQKRDWKALSRGKPRYGNTATLQLVSAFLFGDPYAFTKTPSSIMWEHLPHEFVVGRISKKNKPQISPMAHAQCALLGFNAYKILIELLSTVVVQDVEREYMCTRHTADDNQDDELTCPMLYVYMICDNLIKAKAKGWKTSNGYKKHRDFL